MTQDQIADIYQKANGWSPRAYPNTMTELEAFAKLVAEVEREACAEICDRFQARDVGMQPAECAKAIRARGQE